MILQKNIDKNHFIEHKKGLFQSKKPYYSSKNPLFLRTRAHP